MAHVRPESPDDEATIPDSDRLYLNVGGTVFITSRFALGRYPYTRLGRLATTSLQEVHIDRNPRLMGYILDLYRTGQLHVPRDCCSMAMKCEMLFWEIPTDLVSECCWTMFEEGDRRQMIIDDIDKTLTDDYDGLVGKSPISDHVWNTLSNPSYSRTAKIWNGVYHLFVALASLSFVLESEPSYRYITPEVKATLVGDLPKEGALRFLMYSVEFPSITLLDTICWMFFTVEFFIRLAVSPKSSVFLKSKLNIMDMFLLATVWIIFFTKHYVTDTFKTFNHFFFYTRVTMNSFKAMRVLRIFTVLYRNEYTKIMILSLNASAHPLSLLMVAALIAALIFGALIYLTELTFGDYTFKNVAKATWYGYDTMLAIGSGKMVPTSLPGNIIGVCCSMFGVILFSMPIAIVKESFKQYLVALRIHKHRMVRVKYLMDQGQESALRATDTFFYRPQDDRPASSIIDTDLFMV